MNDSEDGFNRIVLVSGLKISIIDSLDQVSPTLVDLIHGGWGQLGQMSDGHLHVEGVYLINVEGERVNPFHQIAFGEVNFENWSDHGLIHIDALENKVHLLEFLKMHWFYLL